MKRFVFGLYVFIVFTLIVATFLGKIYGTDFTSVYIYGSIPFAFLWGLLVVFALCYLIQQKIQIRLFTFALHFAFVVILSGAVITHFFGKQGTLRLRYGETTNEFTHNSLPQKFPFDITLTQFKVVYYPGTDTPKDFVSSVTIAMEAGNKPKSGEIGMNKIFSYQGYRFYQAGFDNDGKGTHLSISYDPYGIAITYTGYALLLFALSLFFLDKRSHFRQLLHHSVLQKSLLILLIFTGSFFSSYANDPPKVLPREIAQQFGDLNVLYNGRICPLQTLAKDFTVKLYGKANYQGYTAEQIFTGWMFYYSTWEKQPIIKITSKEVRHILSINGKYASYNDFFNTTKRYKLAPYVEQLNNGVELDDKRGLKDANEKFEIINMFYSGQLLKIFPVHQGGLLPIKWYSPSDELPADMSDNHWFFVKKFMDYIFEKVMKKDYAGVTQMLDKIRMHQEKEASEILPSPIQFTAEKFYNSFNYTFQLAILSVITGLLLFFYFVRLQIFHLNPNKYLVNTANLMAACLGLYFTASIVLRTIVSAHLPLTSGYETMQFMAWITFLFSLYLQRKYILALPLGILTGGLILIVASLGESNPQITPLIPVLNSPLLSIHVVVIMLAYSLLAFTMLNGVAAIFMHLSGKDCTQPIEHLKVISNILLYPAIFLLVIGIFVGAIWANISWGRYWGWDPKEVWALITFMIYALAFHPDSLPQFRKPVFFHSFNIVAFFAVLITYFGVNYILGGMHSYGQ